MLSLHLHVDSDNHNSFIASGVEFDGDPFSIAGKCFLGEDDIICVNFTMSYPGDLQVSYYGRLIDQYTIVGDRSYGNEDAKDWTFVLKKIPAQYMIYRPAPEVLIDPSARPRALWRYAIHAMLHDVRRQHWSWSYFAARRDARKTYIATRRRESDFRQSFEKYIMEMTVCRQSCIAQDVRFYESIASQLSNMQPYRRCAVPLK